MKPVLAPALSLLVLILLSLSCRASRPSELELAPGDYGFRLIYGGGLMDKLSTAIVLLILVLVAHLVEEVKTGFRKELPVGEMPLPVFIGINVFIYAFCCATLFLSRSGNALAVPLSWAFAIAMLMNGLGHIGITLVRRQYFPGAVTAFVLLPAAGYLMARLASGG